MLNPRSYPYLLVLFCVLLYGMGLSTLPPMDRDEARFAQATKQMIETGDYLDIRFQDTPRYKKPIGIYWLQAGFVQAGQALTGLPLNTIWLYRLPSFFAAIGAVLALYWVGRRVLPTPQQAFIAALLLASSVTLTLEAHLAKTDATVLLTVLLQQGALCMLYQQFRNNTPLSRKLILLFWAALGAGMLVKGFVNPLLAVLTLLTLRTVFQAHGFFSALKPLAGILLPVLMVVPWFLWMQNHSGGQFAQEAVGKDFLNKITSGQESHGAPFGYYALLSPLLFFPASLLLAFTIPTFFHSVRYRWKERNTGALSPLTQVLLAWSIPAWIVFECVPTKLPHYVLPLLPALCLLAVTTPLAACGKTWARGLQYGYAGIAAIGGVGLGIAAVVLPFVLNKTPLTSPLLLLAVVGMVLVGTGLLLLRRKTLVAGFPVLAGCALVLYACIFSSVLPSLKSVWISNTIAAAADGRPIVSIGYSEPSLVFLGGTHTRFTTVEQAFLESDATDTVYVVEDKSEQEFLHSVVQNNKPLERFYTVRGFNYSRGKWLTFGLYQQSVGKSDLKVIQW